MPLLELKLLLPALPELDPWLTLVPWLLTALPPELALWLPLLLPELELRVEPVLELRPLPELALRLPPELELRLPPELERWLPPELELCEE